MVPHDLIHTYLRVAAPRLRPTTVTSYRSDLFQFSAWMESRATSLRKKDVQLAAIEDYQADLHARGLSPRTIERKMQSLRAFFAWAHKRKAIRASPMADYRIPRPDERLARVLTPEEESRVFAVLEVCAHPFDLRAGIPAVRLARYGGLRRGECLALAWENTDLGKMQLFILDAKGGQDRPVPIPQQNLGRCLLDLWVATGRPMRGPVLRGLRHQRISPVSLNDAIRRYYRQARVEGATFHTLRHTYATRLVELGVHARVIQILLGHKSLQTTQRYMHVADAAKRQAADLLDEPVP